MHLVLRPFLVLALIATPLAVSAVTFEPPNRELTAEENKPGSVYRGCIGFHCLEEAPYIGWAMTVAGGCTAGEGPLVPGSLPGSGNLCLSVVTNAREGAVVLVRADGGTPEICHEASEGGLRDETGGDCLAAERGAAILSSSPDRLEKGFARYRIAGGSDDSLIVTTLIGY